MSSDPFSMFQSFSRPHAHISWVIRIVSVLRALLVFLFKECPLFWSRLLQGGRNPRADMEGPYYMIGAPDRQVEVGKAVLASPADLQKFAPYLMSVSVKTLKGDPVPYATFDWWQADTGGDYSLTTYRLRGKFKANAQGTIELLTVVPGEYGPSSYVRAGHFHMMIGPGNSNPDLEVLTTQLYVCPKNDSSKMDTDFLNMVRSPRRNNMLQSWCIPSANKSSQYMGFPELESSDEETTRRVEWWNKRLEQSGSGEGLKIVAGAHTEIRLNTKGWLV